jgi:hypothetical protein
MVTVRRRVLWLGVHYQPAGKARLDAYRADCPVSRRTGSVRPLQDWAFGAPHTQTQAHLNFTPVASVDALNQALEQAKGRPVMLDLYADWCVACKEFEKYTFSNPQVQQALGNTAVAGGCDSKQCPGCRSAETSTGFRFADYLVL